MEEDSIPLKLVERTAQPRRLGELIVGQEGLKARFGKWLGRLHRRLFEEVRGMAGTKGIFNWEEIGQYEDLSEIIPLLPPELVVQRLGAEKAIEAIGAEKAIEAIGAEKAFDASVKGMGKDAALEALRAGMSPEEWRDLLRRHQPEGPEGA